MTAADIEDRALHTDHLQHDLRSRALRGGFATMAGQGAQFVLTLASTVVLARLLAPEDFGLVAMAVAAGSFLSLFSDLGLGSATVQHAGLTRTQLNALFWLNSALGILFALVMVAIAPLVAAFFGQPELLHVTIALALGFVLAGLTAQPSALLRRQMRFVAIARIDVGALVLGTVVGIAGAALGAGYWSLVALTLSQQAAAAAATWRACGWRPSAPARAREVRSLLAFGAGLTGFNMLAYGSRTLDDVIIGRTAGTAALAYYLKAYSLLLLPIERVRGPASAVVIPALSRLQGEPDRFRSYFLKAIGAVVAVGMPAVAFLFVFAEEAILLVLGPQWDASVLLFRILAPAAFVETFNSVGSWACVPLGRSTRLLRWQLLATPVMVASFLLGSLWGVTGVAVGFSLATVALRLPAIVFLLGDTPVRPIDLLKALSRPACASLVAAAIVAALDAAVPIELDNLSTLLIMGPVFGFSYLASWRLLPGGRDGLDEMIGMVREVLASGTKR